MAVYKTKSGKWQARISYRDPNGQVKGVNRTFERKIDARNFETDFRRDLKSETNDRDLITYREIFDAYLIDKSIKVTKKTINEKEYFANRFWPKLINKKYTSITKRDWLGVYNNILKQDLSVSYKNKIIVNIKAIAKYAYQYYDLPDNTKILETLPSRKIVEHNFWTVDEFNQFESFLDNETIKLLIKTLYFTGARRDEVRLLLKSEYDSNTSTIYFKNNEYRTLKNISSERKVKVHSELSKELIKLVPLEGEFLFGGLEPVSKTTLTRHFKRAIDESGVKPIRLHDLRHSHATILINEGANIIAVSKRLGHSNTGQTLKTYAHLMQKNDDELLDIIENI